MCGRYEFTSPKGNEFDFVQWPEIRPDLDIRPTNKAPVILLTEPGHYQVQLREWGFIRSWPGKSGKLVKKTLINAKSEEITMKRSFKKAFAENRCIIPMNAWFEWPEIAEINDGLKTKVRIFMPGRPTFGAAGIYEDVIDKETGEVSKRFSMLTVAPGANSPIKNLHARSPLVLPASDYDAWFSSTPDEMQSLMHPYRDVQAFDFEIVGNRKGSDILI
ncbi:putative SOS response-associated peptidase YedK [Advenella incenata]|uniref:Abasic site processing protein n=1 Tax=Advenella incenata TaxID=267800 RepID=A0A4Q7V3R3_9BURK|nr:SOS response-associated peptidase family protein [Advenella incenata]RZT91076.1 putative SOS response-associated peptidase YedK [Advenella incenata]